MSEQASHKTPTESIDNMDGWQPRPGEMHEVDQAFYDLAIKERNYERVKVDRLEAEVKRLRQGLWDAAALAGVDTDGDETPNHLAYPDIVKWALDAVRELREDYDDALKDAPILPND